MYKDTLANHAGAISLILWATCLIIYIEIIRA